MAIQTPNTEEYLSRSALAEKLGLSLKELTQLMIESGWILQEGKVWHLTAKGEFEGGLYRESKKYGQYIVWPISVADHPMIREINEAVVTISSLAKRVDLPPRFLNRLLAELAWIEVFAKGWQLTSLGESYGGVQSHDGETGIPYVMWPRTLLDKPSVLNSLSYFSNNQSLEALNGLSTLSTAHSMIASWLYTVGLVFSYQRELLLPKGISLKPDFYLPRRQLCIDYWPESLPADALTFQLNKREIYKTQGIRSIEIDQEGLLHLDHELSRELMQLGVTVY
ncbi:MAG: hypothetical protein ACJAUP_001116 [Cellvibrionaceae bacterium]|jgi:hypothetical protein